MEWKSYDGTYKDRMKDLKNLKDEKILKLLRDSKVVKKYETLDFKLGCLWQRLLSSPLERGAGGVLRQIYTPLYPLFLEGNYKIIEIPVRLKSIEKKLGEKQ